MGVCFTEDQQKVIDLRDRNILVSAAAGSGKTAVLVERIITRLTKDATPLNVDELLVVTFTEAAAAEMKERIRNAIDRALEEHPEDVHLQRQATLIHSAQVTTIHSFCLSVIRDYFHVIDLDPAFRIGEESELKLLRRDVVEEMLEEYFAEAQPEFLNFVESFATGRDDKKLEEIILQLYDYSRSYPNPTQWLLDSVNSYDVPTVQALEQSKMVAVVMEEIREMLEDAKDSLEFMRTLCDSENGPVAYSSAICSDLAFVRDLLAETTFSGMYERFSTLKWATLGVNRSKDVSEEKINLVKELRDECKKTITAIRDDYFQETPQRLQEDLLSTKSNMSVLAQLVMDFEHLFTEKKRSKNMIDFGDMEHYALQILTEKQDDGSLIPSAIAKEYQEKYKEVMIDEYQDSNFLQEAILTSVSSVSRDIHNVFMVGDVKQSIYRFRLSRPELFMDKYYTYTETDSANQKVDLHKNFRSRKEVLQSTNFIFKQIMKKQLGGITYDGKAALYEGASYEETSGHETEIYLIDTEDLATDENKREIEAQAIAKRIKSLVEDYQIYDKEAGTYRQAKYRDIVILTRNSVGFTDAFLRVFQEQGIPAYSVSKEGYFSTREIKQLLDYLKILDNPKQDIPFTAVLTSTFAGLTSEELAIVKNETIAKTFYDRVVSYAASGVNESLAKKLSNFLSQYEQFRHMLSYTAIHKLLWQIIDDTGFGEYISSMPAGQQRMVNVEMLVEKAIQFEQTSYKGLFHFVRYIEQLHKYNVDYGEVGIEDEASDVVRMMSIHKSKGLEFPIVIVAGMDKEFTMLDVRGSVVISPELGVGLDVVDVERRTKTNSLLKKVIQNQIKKETVAEELRILYVAMTRAKEKLILTGAVSDLSKQISGLIDLYDREEMDLPYAKLVKAKKYFDWLCPALYRNKAFAHILEQCGKPVPFTNDHFQDPIPISVEFIDRSTLDELGVREEMIGEFSKKLLLELDTTRTFDRGFREYLEGQISFCYPYQTDPRMKQKVSVSELKKLAYVEEDEMDEVITTPMIPKFRQGEKKLSGAARGSAYHKVMELLDFTKEYSEQSIRDTIVRMVQKGHLTEEMVKCISAKDILCFLESAVGQRMQLAACQGKYRAEQPFVLAQESGQDDVSLIQGIIDVYFEEDDQLVLLDYKTDFVREAEELVEKYHIQLDYYAKALEQITQKKVKEKIIYSFALHQEISL